MELLHFIVGHIDTNCYVPYDPETGEAIVIDPGGNAHEILAKLTVKRLHVHRIILTHGHFDHMLAADAIRKRTGAKIAVHRGDAELLSADPSSLYKSIMREPYSACEPDIMLSGGEKTRIAGIEAEIIHTPGHTPGSVIIRMDNALFTGDTLFEGDCGRTDLPGGDPRQMRMSLRMIAGFEFDYLIYPGHGPATTLEFEKRNNPDLRAAAGIV